jgi:hypothetical protein
MPGRCEKGLAMLPIALHTSNRSWSRFAHSPALPIESWVSAITFRYSLAGPSVAADLLVGDPAAFFAGQQGDDSRDIAGLSDA